MVRIFKFDHHHFDTVYQYLMVCQTNKQSRCGGLTKSIISKITYGAHCAMHAQTFFHQQYYLTEARLRGGLRNYLRNHEICDSLK